jgi:excisionase family DNA binding protein
MAEAATMAEMVLGGDVPPDNQHRHPDARLAEFRKAATIHARVVPMQADNPPAHLHRKLRPAARAAYTRGDPRAGAISREQAAVHLGVDYSTLEKLAAHGEGPFCFRIGNLIRYPVDELEAWKRANDARQAHTQRNDVASGIASQQSGLWGWLRYPCTQE